MPAVRVPQERLHYMDHLRALAMLAGVFFHAALAYSPVMNGFFPTADRQTSVWVDAVVWGLHLVRMRSEEHTSELQSLMRISYAVFCLKKKTKENLTIHIRINNHGYL